MHPRSPLLALALVTLPLAATAETIDSFKGVTATLESSGGNSVFAYRADTAILGGARQAHVRDAHSGSLGGRSRLTFDDAAGTVGFWGNTAPETDLLYGTWIGALYGGGGQPVGPALNLRKHVTDSIDFDVVTVPAAGFSLTVTLKTGAGDFQLNKPMTTGTVSFRFADFAGITSAALADIDGIRISGYTSSDSPGLVVSELRVTSNPPPARLITVTDLSSGDANCAHGGVRIDNGLDDGQGAGDPGDGVLHADEVDGSSYACNGAPGANGTNGTNGLPGLPGASGTPGTPGSNGADGRDVLIDLVDEAAGENCAEGGVKVLAGQDANRDDVLDASEVSSTEYICNGATGAAGPAGPAGPAGAAACSSFGGGSAALVGLLGLLLRTRRRRS